MMKYGEAYLEANIANGEQGWLRPYSRCYNPKWHHQSLDCLTPAEMFNGETEIFGEQ